MWESAREREREKERARARTMGCCVSVCVCMCVCLFYVCTYICNHGTGGKGVTWEAEGTSWTRGGWAQKSWGVSVSICMYPNMVYTRIRGRHFVNSRRRSSKVLRCLSLCVCMRCVCIYICMYAISIYLCKRTYTHTHSDKGREGAHGKAGVETTGVCIYMYVYTHVCLCVCTWNSRNASWH